MKKSIRRQLFIAFVGLAIVPLLLLGGIFSWLSYTAIKGEALKLQTEMAKEPAVRLDTLLLETTNYLSLASDMYFLNRQDRDVAMAFLKMLMVRDPFEKIMVIGDQGETKLSLSRLGLSSDERADHSDDPAFVAVQETGAVYYSPVWFDEVAGEPLMTIARPLMDLRTGLSDGALIAQIRLKVMWELIADVKVLPGQSLYVIDANDRLVAHANPSLVLRGTTFQVPDHEGVHRGLTGETTLMAVQTVRYGNQEFNVVAEQKTADAYALAEDLLMITAILVVLALTAAGGLGLLVVRQIVLPVQSMARTARNISVGDLSQRVKIRANNELGVLAEAFNSMTTQLQALIDGLEQKVDERTRQLETAQKELLQQERLATLGKVIATIAHEIRNPLGTVNTSIFSIRLAMEKEDTVRVQRAIGLAERNIKRCDDIITELLDYTRKLEVRPSKVDLDGWMNEILDEQRFPEEISCRRELGSGLEISIDLEHMRRAVVNTLANAMHALSDTDTPEKELAVETGISDGRAEIRIVDNGSGIPEDLQEKIFEPLFSTKSFGVGLGLSVIRDIMEAHNGGVDIESEAGRGTRVVLWVPLGPVSG
jgi:signal transduction histidine kinase